MKTKRVGIGAVFACALALVGLLTTSAPVAALGMAAALIGAAFLPSWFARVPVPKRMIGSSGPLPACIRIYPLALGLGAVDRRLSAAALIAVGAILFARIRVFQRLGFAWQSAVVLCVIAQSIFVYGFDAPGLSLGAAVAALLVISLWQSELNRAVALEAVMDSLAIYLVASIVGYYGLGLRSVGSVARLGGYDSTFSFLSFRVFFPFATSMVTTPVLACAYLCWALPRCVSRVVRPSGLTVAGVPAGIFALLAADYRVPIMVLVLSLAAVALGPRLLRVASIPFAIGLLLLPFWWNNGQNPVTVVTTSVISSGGSSLQRGSDANDHSTLNNRTRLWYWAGDAYRRSPPVKRVLGWGYAGQVKSGAAQGFFNVARGFSASRTGILAHSTAWQTLLDGGLLGLGLLGLLIIAGLAAAGSWSPFGNRAAVVSSPLLPVFALVATAGTEVTLSASVGSESFWVLVLLVSVSIRTSPDDRLSSARELASVAP